MAFSVSRLHCVKAGQRGDMRDNSSKYQTFQDLADRVQVGDRPVTGRVRRVKAALFKQRCDLGYFKFLWKGGLAKREIS